MAIFGCLRLMRLLARAGTLPMALIFLVEIPTLRETIISSSIILPTIVLTHRQIWVVYHLSQRILLDEMPQTTFVLLAKEPHS